MASWIFCLFIFVLMFTTNGGADFGNKNSNNYGPFTVEWKNCNTCRGYKPLNMTKYIQTLIAEPNGTYRYLLNVTFLEKVHIDEMKLKVYTVKDSKKTIMWNVNIKKPCSHYMMAAFLETYFNVTNCWVKKGEMFVDLPLNELMMKYTGESFFYGDYFFQVIVSSKTANLACLNFDPTFKKKITH